jgi:hypothetical protein
MAFGGPRVSRVFVVLGLLYCAVTLSGCPQKEKLKVRTARTLDMVEEDPNCFPADAVVISSEGPKRMADVQIGDSLLGMEPEGEVVFSKVRGWLHRQPEGSSSMTVIETDGGSTIASAKHSIGTPMAGRLTYMYADAFQVGHQVYSRNGSAVTVRGIGEKVVHGFYSPLTMTSNFFVGTTADSVLLAHGFAHFPVPVFGAKVVHTLCSIGEFFSSTLHDVDGSEQKYLHPVAHFLLTFFPVVDVSLDSHSDSFPLLKGFHAITGAGGDPSVHVV